MRFLLVLALFLPSFVFASVEFPHHDAKPIVVPKNCTGKIEIDVSQLYLVDGLKTAKCKVFDKNINGKWYVIFEKAK